MDTGAILTFKPQTSTKKPPKGYKYTRARVIEVSLNHIQA